jgi:hypothetical protein
MNDYNNVLLAMEQLSQDLQWLGYTVATNDTIDNNITRKPWSNAQIHIWPSGRNLSPGCGIFVNVENMIPTPTILDKITILTKIQNEMRPIFQKYGEYKMEYCYINIKCPSGNDIEKQIEELKQNWFYQKLHENEHMILK